jgi:hypothetical protein
MHKVEDSRRGNQLESGVGECRNRNVINVVFELVLPVNAVERRFCTGKFQQAQDLGIAPRSAAQVFGAWGAQGHKVLRRRTFERHTGILRRLPTM